MNSIEIVGGNPLHGEISVQGSKNGVLPILAGTILIAGVTVLHNCPKIIDVEYMVQILESVGCDCKWSNHSLTVDASKVKDYHIPVTLAKEMRSSIVFLGSLLGRKKRAFIPHPGGCVIGDRPIDIHLKALQDMNVKIKEKENYLYAKVRKIKSTELILKSPSVGATENIILASVLSKGTTYIKNAAKEPEIVELCNFLNQAGADISGAGSEIILIKGVPKLQDVEYEITSDRIVAGTYILAATATRGNIVLKNAPIKQLDYLIKIMEDVGAVIEINGNDLHIHAEEAKNAVTYIKTEPYPGFPTDLQSQMLVTLSIAEGTSVIEETIFEQRFRIVDELIKMGADIKIEDKKVIINGVGNLTGNTVTARELRGGAALVLAGLIAKGETKVVNAHFIARGYEDICGDLKSLGADIKYN